jgi:hypothetical protein
MPRPGTLVITLIVAASLVADAAEDDGRTLDAIADLADGEGRVETVVTLRTVTPLGDGLSRVGASWEGQELIGLVEGRPALGPVSVEGTVVSARGTGAFIGVAHVKDGLSNTVMFLAPGTRLPATQGFLDITFADVLVSSLRVDSVDHVVVTTPSGTPFAGAVVPPRLVSPAGTFSARVAVRETPLGPVGTVPHSGIIAILIGL